MKSNKFSSETNELLILLLKYFVISFLLACLVTILLYYLIIAWHHLIKIEKNPHRSVSLTMQIQAENAIRKGNFDKAKIKLNAILKVNPLNESALYNLAVILDQENQIQKAEQLYKKVISINPSHAYSLGGLGWVAFQQNDYKKALKYSLNAIENEPSLIPARFNSGLAYVALGNLKEAMEQYIQAEVKDVKGRFISLAVNDLTAFIRSKKPHFNEAYFPLAYFYKLAGSRNLEKIALQNFLNNTDRNNKSFRHKANFYLKEIEAWEKKHPPKKSHQK